MKLVAALACRNNSNRLYAKPLQKLGRQSVLEYIVRQLQDRGEIDEIVLAISEAPGNEAYADWAKSNGIKFVTGDDNDVLDRLIKACEFGGGDTVFRMTTESPFPYLEGLARAKQSHQERSAHYTTFAKLPDGCSFELIPLEVLKTCHRQGGDRHRSELCTLYINENRSQFNLNVLEVPEEFQRPDYRLTIDFPEDLILCRRVVQSLGEKEAIPFSKLIGFLDEKPELRAMVNDLNDESYVRPYF